MRFGHAPPRRITMVKCFVKLAVPGMVANMMGFITISLNPIFAGRLGDPSLLAGVGVGSVLVLVFLITVYMGLNAA